MKVSERLPGEEVCKESLQTGKTKAVAKIKRPLLKHGPLYDQTAPKRFSSMAFFWLKRVAAV